MKILGLTIQANTRNDQTLYNLSKATDQVIHMIRRITSRHQGMKEKDTLRLVQAFVISLLTNVAPYIVPTRTDTDKPNHLTRKATKQALGLPMSTSMAKLLSMGLHNTIEELIEGHISSQSLRLAQTKAGRAVLRNIQWSCPDQAHLVTIPDAWRQPISVRLLPRNMHSDLHPGHIEARRKAHEKLRPLPLAGTLV